MTVKADLHVHTTASDGALTPAEVVAMASRLGLEVLAITDHDTVSGVAEALERAASLPLEIIPGVEISAEQNGVQVHMLGYFVDHTSPDLIQWLDRFREARLRRAHKTLERLAELGIRLAWELLAEAAQEGVVGRPHIAKALIEAGYVSSIEEAFARYLSPGQPAYVPRCKAKPAEAIQMIRRAGGVPVLAHPWCTTFLLEGLVAQGLLGLETHYRDYDNCQIGRLSRLAAEYGLIRTGGADFHGLPSDTRSLGQVALPCGCVADLDTLRAALQGAQSRQAAPNA